MKAGTTQDWACPQGMPTYTKHTKICESYHINGCRYWHCSFSLTHDGDVYKLYALCDFKLGLEMNVM